MGPGRLKARPRGESDLGKPTPKIKLPTSNGSAFEPIEETASLSGDHELMSLLPELLTGILLPLPFFLAALAYPTDVSSDSGGPLTLVSLARLWGAWPEEHGPTTPGASRATYVPMLEASWLASLTLLVLGILASWMHSAGRFAGKDEDLVSQLAAGFKRYNLKTVFTKRMVSRILGIWLPYFAALQLGGLRIGLLLLLTFSSGVPYVVRQIVAGASWSVVLQSVNKRKFSCLAIVLSMLADAVGLTAGVPRHQLFLGYLALFASILIVPFPASMESPKGGSTSTTPVSAFFPRTWISPSTSTPSILSPLISTPQSGIQTFVAGAVLLVSTLSISFFFPTVLHLTYPAILLSILAIISTAGLAFLAQPSTLQSSTKLGVAAGCSIVVIFDCMSHWSFSWKIPIICSIWPTWAYLAAFFDIVDITTLKIFTHDDDDGHGHGHSHISHSHATHTPHSELCKHSRVTGFLLSLTSPGSVLHSILSERDSRRIFYFGSLNLAFMAVQFAYGLITGSLGLLTDSIHMLFDCAGLVVGLAAAIVTKWPPSERFPYGLGKVDALSGFGNGIFLVLVSFEVLFEAFHRFRDGAQLRRLNELLVISVLGLLVNLVGLTVFGDAHHGHHRGHDHGHAHSHKHDHDHDHAKLQHKNSNGSLHRPGTHSLQPSPLPSLPQSPLSAPPLTPETIDQETRSHSDHSDSHDHSHSHAHSHDHPHNNENMQGIFLHVLADTLGSVAVIASTLLAQHTGWSGWDPLASAIVAVMIFISAVPLTKTCARNLMIVLGDDVEYSCKDALHGVGELRGVAGYHAVRFWVVEMAEGGAHHHGHSHGHGDGEKAKRVCGVMHVLAAGGVDVDDLRERTVMYLKGRGMDVLVQVEREGVGTCECRGR